MRFTWTLRRKFVVAFAGIAFLVAALVGFISYSVTRHGLDDEINRSLVSAATTLAAGGTVLTTTTDDPPGGGVNGRRGGQDDGIVQAGQIVDADGSVTVLVGTKSRSTRRSTCSSRPAPALRCSELWTSTPGITGCCPRRSATAKVSSRSPAT